MAWEALGASELGTDVLFLFEACKFLFWEVFSFLPRRFGSGVIMSSLACICLLLFSCFLFFWVWQEITRARELSRLLNDQLML